MPAAGTGRRLFAAAPSPGAHHLTPFASFLTRHPRLAAAIAFGGATALVTHLAWVPSARTSGLAPFLTTAAGLAHAAAGAFTGPRLIDRRRTRASPQAALLGAGTSLLAVAFFAPAFSAYLETTNAGHSGPLAYLVTVLYTALFSFLGAGWALLVVSAGVGWALHRLSTPQ